MKISKYFFLILIASQCPTLLEASSIWDQLPIISQVKSAVQAIAGDTKGAKETQNNFSRGIFLPAPIVRSVVELIKGDTVEAAATWKSSGRNIEGIVDGLPVVGHVKGGVHYAIGDSRRGDQIIKSASRTTGVIAGGVGGFFVGGPVGAAAGGLAGGVAMDGIITGIDSAASGEYRPSGHVKGVSDVVQGKSSVGCVFDSVMNVAGDAAAGWGAGNIAQGIQGASAGTNSGSFSSSTYTTTSTPAATPYGSTTPSVWTGPLNYDFTGLGGSATRTSTASAPAVMYPQLSVYVDLSGLNSAGTSSVLSSPAVMYTPPPMSVPAVVATTTSISPDNGSVPKHILKGVVPNPKDIRSWAPPFGDPDEA